MYSYGNEDRSDRLTDFNGEAITYDEKGCPIIYRGNACTYTRGTLLSAYGNNTFDYDADGIRTKKNSTTFTYADDKLIRQIGGGATIDFIYGASGVVGFKYNNNIYIYRRNLMGDVTHIYDTAGVLKAHYIYDAWGNHRIVTDVNGIGTLNPIRYRGYYYDTETGLYYLKARYYDPETGRFISQDDMAYIVSEHLMGLNLYAYCNNNPVMNTDPSGHAVVAVTVAAFAKVVLIGAAVGALSGIITSAITYSITAGEFTWRGFGAAVAGGAVSGAISGGVSTACSILSPVGVVIGNAVGGGLGGFAGSLVESAILGEDLSKWETWKPILSDTAWSAAGGALGGLVSGPAGSSAGAVATKFFKHPIKNALTDLCENLIMDFTTWYSKFVTEGVIESYS